VINAGGSWWLKGIMASIHFVLNVIGQNLIPIMAKEGEKIVWIGGYPFVDGVSAPPDTKSEDPLEQKLLDDVQWEVVTELKGWAKVQAFLKRVFDRS
jgi:hypothetical protein